MIKYDAKTGTLTATVHFDPKGKYAPSASSGKNLIVATSGGNQIVDAATGLRFGFTCYVPNPESKKAD